jgi:type I restriction enzyme M protein
MSLSNTVKAIQDIMRKDAGVDGDAQRIGQLGWMLFLKIYSDLELETELEDSKYKSPIPRKFRWESWADESVAGKNSLTGDALINFINNELFPKLKELDLSSFTGQARERGTLLISVFDDAYNYMKNGTLLRQVINKINQDIDYNSVETRHLFGDIYEQILRDLQNAGNAGEYYTPRAVTQFAIEMVNPQLGEIVLDPACGTGGFLTGAFEHMKKQVKKPSELKALKNSIRGVEKKPLPHVLCATNMMVHGIEVPSNIVNDNTLAKPLRDYGKKDQVDIIITNPPFGGVEEDGIENNFPAEFRTKETADLFLILVMELLKDGGRAAIVLPDGTLFGDGIKTKIKKKMLDECNLHTIVRLPKSVFAPYTTIATNVLFLTKGEATKEVWFYEHKLPVGVKAYSKTKPMQLQEFDSEKLWWSNRIESEVSWKVSVEELNERNFNLDIKNPNNPAEIHGDPAELLEEYRASLEKVSLLQQQLRMKLERAMNQS